MGTLTQENTRCKVQASYGTATLSKTARNLNPSHKVRFSGFVQAGKPHHNLVANSPDVYNFRISETVTVLAMKTLITMAIRRYSFWQHEPSLSSQSRNQVEQLIILLVTKIASIMHTSPRVRANQIACYLAWLRPRKNKTNNKKNEFRTRPKRVVQAYSPENTTPPPSGKEYNKT